MSFYTTPKYLYRGHDVCFSENYRNYFEGANNNYESVEKDTGGTVKYGIKYENVIVSPSQQVPYLILEQPTSPDSLQKYANLILPYKHDSTILRNALVIVETDGTANQVLNITRSDKSSSSEGIRLGEISKRIQSSYRLILPIQYEKQLPENFIRYGGVFESVAKLSAYNSKEVKCDYMDWDLTISITKNDNFYKYLTVIVPKDYPIDNQNLEIMFKPPNELGSEVACFAGFSENIPEEVVTECDIGEVDVVGCSMED